MIGRIRGHLVLLREEIAIVEAGGVGYELEVPASTRQSLPPVGSEVALWCRVYVREDELRLFGFASLEERDLFDQLLTVSGVGPRLALAVLSTYSPSRFRQIVLAGDRAALTRVPGVGRKTADRWLLELQGRIPLVTAGGQPEGGRAVSSTGGVGKVAVVAGQPGDPLAEAHEALLALGYTENEASSALRELLAAGTLAAGAPVEDWVKQALRRLAPRTVQR